MLSLCALLTLVFAVSGIRAETIGDEGLGRDYAEKVCSSCHAVEPDALRSPVAEAPPFQAVANTPGMTRTALVVFFRTPHKTMPNLIIKGEDADNVIAYILGLKRQN